MVTLSGEVLQKVTAFVTRPSAHGMELLVFRHPQAGVQLPAGTVESGETAVTAAFREVHEETGLKDVALVRPLGVDNELLPEQERGVLRLTQVFNEPTSDASGTGFILRRGLRVQVRRTVASFAEIAYEEYDWNESPPALVTSERGWVHASLLTRQIERHFFHLTCTAVTPETWAMAADDHLFQLYWTPLRPRPLLVTGQAAWLDKVYEALITS